LWRGAEFRSKKVRAKCIISSQIKKLEKTRALVFYCLDNRYAIASVAL